MINELQARIGRTMTMSEADQAPALLDDVMAAVRVYTGQQFERAVYTIRARVKRRYVRLSQRPVHDVESVTDRWGNEISFTWDGLDRVYINHLSGRAPLQVVDIAYDAGPDEVPAVVVGVVCSVAARALGVDPTEGAVTQESIDGYSFTLGGAGGARAFGILPQEKAALDVFRRPIGNIAVAW